MEDEGLLTPKQVAKHFAISEAQLCRKRLAGEGPPWVLVSERCPRYRREAVAAWIKENEINGRQQTA